MKLVVMKARDVGRVFVLGCCGCRRVYCNDGCGLGCDWFMCVFSRPFSVFSVTVCPLGLSMVVVDGGLWPFVVASAACGLTLLLWLLDGTCGLCMLIFLW